MKPIIGIIMRDTESIKNLNINREVCKSVSLCGGIPIGIYPDISNINFVVNMCDGFILQGGDFFSSYDVNLVDLLYKLNKPLLGICLGMQTMSWWANGILDKINNCSHKNINNLFVHNVKILENSRLYTILRKKEIIVNSRHQDCVIKTDMFVSGISPDGIIESVELLNHKFFIGVQWHPETLFEFDDDSKKIFQAFLDSCGE